MDIGWTCGGGDDFRGMMVILVDGSVTTDEIFGCPMTVVFPIRPPCKFYFEFRDHSMTLL